MPVDLFFYREPEELEKAEEAQAPFQEPPAVAVPGWGAEPMVGTGPAPTPMEGFAAVDPAAVQMEYQPPQAQAAVGGGWDSAPDGGTPAEEVPAEQQQAQQQQQQPAQETMPIDSGVSAGGGWDPAQPQAAQSGGWGEGSASTQGGGW